MADQIRGRGSKRLLAVAAVVVLAFWLLATRSDNPADANLYDNVHWTVAAVAAAWLVWRARGAGDASDIEATARRRFAWAMSCAAVAQVLWDARGYWQDRALPIDPSDAAFLLVGPIFVYAFAGILAGSLPAQRLRFVPIDVAGLGLAVLAVVLTLYLPNAQPGTVLATVLSTAFPVLIFFAVATALVMQLHLRQRWDQRWNALFAGLAGLGILDLLTFLQERGGGREPGSVIGLGLSACLLLAGWGAAGWRLHPDSSARFDRLCEGALRQLAFAMSIITLIAFALVLMRLGAIDLPMATLLALELGVLIVAVIRQTQQLGERDRMLAVERVASEGRARLQFLAHHDSLTGLPNRTLLRDRVEQALASAARRGTKVAIFFLDLDQFKEVNDTLGHVTGDSLLRHVAGQLLSVTRASDTVSRQGGDEFTIVLPDIDRMEDAAQVAGKITELASIPARISESELPLSVSVSIGIALYPDNAGDFDGLLRCADTAMYGAKASGRNTYRFFDSRMNIEAANRMNLRMRLAGAIERGELHLHYQPLVGMADGRICGAEALLRWNSAELGAVAPSSFIPVAEDSGLIVEIGGWVLRQACQQAVRWSAQGLPAIRVAVNVSVLQFRRGTLESQVLDALQGTGASPQMLELEVTESVLMEDQDRVIATLDRLADMGVSIAVDDFGTGYSSLAYVRRMHLSKIKIDKAFVHDAVRDEGGAAIVRAMIEMARAMRVTTVAEGVETEQQRDFLQGTHCDICQGFLFSRPLAPADFERYLVEHALPGSRQQAGVAAGEAGQQKVSR